MGDAACDLRFGKFIEGGRKGAREGGRVGEVGGESVLAERMRWG